MKKFTFFVLILLCLHSCKGGTGNSRAVTNVEDVPQVAQETAGDTAGKQLRHEDFTFDELFRIFSIFGGNVMTDKYASQYAKDEAREQLLDVYSGFREFNGDACNFLVHSKSDGDCYDGMCMGCWRFDADGHYLVLLAENGGCDAWATKYIRAYDYNPESGNAHEIEIPFNPQPVAADFDDPLRLVGCNNADYIRDAMRDRVYNYDFNPEGVNVMLNTLDDFEVGAYSAMNVFYRWNGSELVRDYVRPYPCIHNDGFALIKLGEAVPDLKSINGQAGCNAVYSEGGDLWIVSKGSEEVLEIQMKDGKVHSIEIKSPEYSVTSAAFWDGKGVVRVGSLINDFFDFSKEHAQEVWLFSDGTVQIADEEYSTVFCFRRKRSGSQPERDEGQT